MRKDCFLLQKAVLIYQSNPGKDLAAHNFLSQGNMIEHLSRDKEGFLNKNCRLEYTPKQTILA